ncbi:MAG: 16S rRNA (cytidine(1402)-2'-O)-methyltransferase [Bacteroidetes bacterium]|nr:16S rRNA (cytidine(1402)-2'-O)-methyltransferase [Bacteroidota bacterium]MBU1421625.1 16S rRNA (cytidine(1402)-2'-O)-methyltransferase [Bacteroidota bacterium]
MPGVLYLVATPIGNYDDITLRALNVLKSVDIVVGEELREVKRLLKHYDINKPIELLNEHNEQEESDRILKFLRENKSIALVSDSGTPVFSDPGRILVKKAIANKIRIIPIPGASSLLLALTVTGFDIEKFVFVGWLSPKKEERKRELKNLLNEKRTMVLMDTPYRLLQLLRDIVEVFGNNRKICISFNLTLPDEEIFHGSAVELYKKVSERNLKGEFVIVIGGMDTG